MDGGGKPGGKKGRPGRPKGAVHNQPVLLAGTNTAIVVGFLRRSSASHSNNGQASCAGASRAADECIGDQRNRMMNEHTEVRLPRSTGTRTPISDRFRLEGKAGFSPIPSQNGPNWAQTGKRALQPKGSRATTPNPTGARVPASTPRPTPAVCVVRFAQTLRPFGGCRALACLGRSCACAPHRRAERALRAERRTKGTKPGQKGTHYSLAVPSNMA